MAVAHDALSRSSTSFDNNDVSWTHTPVGTPRGVVVLIAQEGGATDEVSGVTYGGVAMTRVRREVRATAEAGQVWIYFLGSGVPSGAQTVAVSLNTTPSSNDWAAHCATVTAATTTTESNPAGGAGGTSAAAANPSLTIAPTAAAVLYYVIWTGLAAPVTTVQTGGTHNFGNDFGADSMMSSRKAVSAGSTTMGYTAASDVFAHAAVGVSEPSGTSDAAPCGLASSARPTPAARVATPGGVSASAGAQQAASAQAAVDLAQALAAGTASGSQAAGPAVLGLAAASAPAQASAAGAGTAQGAGGGVAVAARQGAASGLAVAQVAAPGSSASLQASAGLVLAAGPAVGARHALAPVGTQATRALVPAYIYPTWYLPGGSQWDDLEADPLGISYVVMNQDSGMGTASNSDWALEISEAKAAGLRVLAYVPTGYGTQPVADVKMWMGNHRDWYDVAGFFLDEAASVDTDLPYYQELRDWADANMAPGNRTLVLNHGTSPDEGFAAIGDVLVTYENTGASYAAATFPAWMDTYPPSRFAHIVHTTAEVDWRAVRALADARRVGHLYVTDQPYSALPSYWREFQDSMSVGVSSAGGAVFPGVAARQASSAGAPLGAGQAPSSATTVTAASGLALAAGTPAGSSAFSSAPFAAASVAGVSPGSAAAAPAPLGQGAGAGAGGGAVAGAPSGAAAGAAGVQSAAVGATAGSAQMVGATPTSTTSASALPGAAAGAGIVSSSSASESAGLGLARAVGFSPSAGGPLDTTPIPGVAAGFGAAPGSLAAVSAPAGSGAAANVAPSTRSAAPAGTGAAGAGQPSSGASAGSGGAQSASGGAGASAATTAGVVSWVLTTLGAASITTAAGATVVPTPAGSSATELASLGVAITVGFSPLAGEPPPFVTLTATVALASSAVARSIADVSSSSSSRTRPASTSSGRAGGLEVTHGRVS